MWTYLAIFLSFATVLFVFVSRAVWLSREKKGLNKAAISVFKKSKKTFGQFFKISRSDKSKARSLFTKAEVKLRLGYEEEGIKLLIQAISTDPSHLESKERLGMLYMQKQMFPAASAVFQELSLMSNDVLHYSHLGFAYFKHGDFKNALTAYQKAVSLDNTRPQRFVSLSQTYRALGKPHHAIMALEKALDIERAEEFLFLLADLLIEIGQKRKAKIVLEEILSADPKNKQAKDLLKSLA